MASDHDIGAIECAAMLGDLSRQGLAFRAELAARWNPGSVHGALEFTKYASGLVIEVWTELTVNPEHDHVVWWLDILPRDDEWLVESSAYFKHHQTEEQTFFLKEKHLFSSFDAARDALPEHMRKLLATIAEASQFLEQNGYRNS